MPTKKPLRRTIKSKKSPSKALKRSSATLFEKELRTLYQDGSKDASPRRIVTPPAGRWFVHLAWIGVGSLCAVLVFLWAYPFMQAYMQFSKALLSPVR